MHPARAPAQYTTIHVDGDLSVSGNLHGLESDLGSQLGLPDGRRVRVDNYLIPLSEIEREPGQTIRLAFWARSAVPPILLNSVGYASSSEYCGKPSKVQTPSCGFRTPARQQSNRWPR